MYSAVGCNVKIVVFESIERKTEKKIQITRKTCSFLCTVKFCFSKIDQYKITGLELCALNRNDFS